MSKDIFETDLCDNNSQIAIQHREEFERNLTNIWGHSSLGLEAKKAAMSMLSTKNGMYARIPLICKGSRCPYAQRCPLLTYNLAPEGEACPKETAELELRYAAYDKDFDLDNASFTDKNLVSELINYDIMLDRLRALIAEEEIMTIEVVAGVSESGEEFTRPEVSKTWEAYERVEKKRNNVYDLMLATRKSNKSNKDEEGTKSITQVISEMMSANDFIIDVKPDDVE